MSCQELFGVIAEMLHWALCSICDGTLEPLLMLLLSLPLLFEGGSYDNKYLSMFSRSDFSKTLPSPFLQAISFALFRYFTVFLASFLNPC